MNRILNVYKPIGATPLQMIHAVRKAYPEYKDVKIGYAGRLDPLAHGVLVLMISDAAKERDKYLSLQKTYEFEVLFGVETDTYDIMGFPVPGRERIIDKDLVNIFVNKRIGTSEQSYPPFSSKSVQGKPLFWWAKQNKLSEITLPTHEINISAFELLSTNTIETSTLLTLTKKHIQLVSGDFRQEEILMRWSTLLQQTKQQNFQTAKFCITCSSGTYVRGLVQELGKELGNGAIALDILRTRVGSYSLKESLRLVAGE